jgi:hypothetical protein
MDESAMVPCGPSVGKVTCLADLSSVAERFARISKQMGIDSRRAKELTRTRERQRYCSRFATSAGGASLSAQGSRRGRNRKNPRAEEESDFSMLASILPDNSIVPRNRILD